MKKLICFILIALLLFSTVSCVQTENGDTDSNGDTELNSGTVDDTTEEINNTDDDTKSAIIADVFGGYPRLAHVCETMEEYNEFIETYILPDTFIEFDTISYLGEFSSLEIYCDIPSLEWKVDDGDYYPVLAYSYGFNDDSFFVGFRPMEKDEALAMFEKHNVDKTIDIEGNDLASIDIAENDRYYYYYNTSEYSGKYIYHKASFPEVEGLEQVYLIMDIDNNHDYLVIINLISFDRVNVIYDFSSEELNKFLYKDTAPEAYKKLCDSYENSKVVPNS